MVSHHIPTSQSIIFGNRGQGSCCGHRMWCIRGQWLYWFHQESNRSRCRQRITLSKVFFVSVICTWKVFWVIYSFLFKCRFEKMFSGKNIFFHVQHTWKSSDFFSQPWSPPGNFIGDVVRRIFLSLAQKGLLFDGGITDGLKTQNSLIASVLVQIEL